MEPVTLIGAALGIWLAIAHSRRSDTRKAARYAELRHHHEKRGDWPVRTPLGTYILPPWPTVPHILIEDAHYGRPEHLLRWLEEHGYPELPTRARRTLFGIPGTRALPSVLTAWQNYPGEQ